MQGGRRHWGAPHVSFPTCAVWGDCTPSRFAGVALQRLKCVVSCPPCHVLLAATVAIAVEARVTSRASARPPNRAADRTAHRVIVIGTASAAVVPASEVPARPAALEVGPEARRAAVRPLPVAMTRRSVPL